MNQMSLNAAIMSFAFSGMLAPHQRVAEPDHPPQDLGAPKASVSAAAPRAHPRWRFPGLR